VFIVSLAMGIGVGSFSPGYCFLAAAFALRYLPMVVWCCWESGGGCRQTVPLLLSSAV